MESLPWEILDMVIQTIVEENPIKDMYNTRCVNRRFFPPPEIRIITGTGFFEAVVTEAWIGSARLEKELGASYNSQRGLSLFPVRLRSMYLRRKLKDHEKRQTRFSVWINRMLKTERAMKEDRDTILNKILNAVARGNLMEACLSSPYDSEERELIEWEPLEQTLCILLANEAIESGDAKQLEQLLADGHDLTRRSDRFGLFSIGVRGTLPNREIAQVLRRHHAPLIVRSLRFRVNVNYLSVPEAVNDPNRLDERVRHVTGNFPGAVMALLHHSIGYANRIRRPDFLQALHKIQEREVDTDRRGSFGWQSKLY